MVIGRSKGVLRSKYSKVTRRVTPSHLSGSQLEPLDYVERFLAFFRFKNRAKVPVWQIGAMNMSSSGKCSGVCPAQVGSTHSVLVQV